MQITSKRELKYFQRKRKFSYNSISTDSTDDENFYHENHQIDLLTLNYKINQNQPIHRCQIIKNNHQKQFFLPTSNQQQNKQNLIDKNKYKTELCKNYSQTGQCPYKKKCKFAHGHHQLINTDKVKQGKQYRTRKCNSFWNDGRCSYGQRCQFKHEYIEKETLEILKLWKMLFITNDKIKQCKNFVCSSKLLKLLQVQYYD